MAGVQGQRFGEVSAGDHIVFIYDDTLELTAFVVPFIKEGLTRGERCLYVFDDLGLTEVTEALAAGEIDVDRERQRRALVLMNGEEYAGPPPIDPLRLAGLINKRVTEAGSSSFAGLRLAAEMTWTLKARAPDQALVEYELLVEGTTGPGPLTAACMYRRDRFNPATLRQLIRTHAKVVAGEYVYLSLSALFHNLARVDIQELAQSARERRVPKGGFYFHQGDPASEIFMLMSGTVKLVRTDPDGRSVILRVVKSMEPFGDRAALLGTTRLSSAEALEDSRALAWDGATIRQAIIIHPAVSLNAIRLLEERVEHERGRFIDLATVSVERRLARLLLRLAQSVGKKTADRVVIGVSLSRQDLAELVITTPYTISRILAEWRRLDIVDTQRERTLLLDQERLAAIADIRAGGEPPEVGEDKPPP